MNIALLSRDYWKISVKFKSCYKTVNRETGHRMDVAFSIVMNPIARANVIT